MRTHHHHLHHHHHHHHHRPRNNNNRDATADDDDDHLGRPPPPPRSRPRPRRRRSRLLPSTCEAAAVCVSLLFLAGTSGCCGYCHHQPSTVTSSSSSSSPLTSAAASHAATALGSTLVDDGDRNGNEQRVGREEGGGRQQPRLGAIDGTDEEEEGEGEEEDEEEPWRRRRRRRWRIGSDDNGGIRSGSGRRTLMHLPPPPVNPFRGSLWPDKRDDDGEDGNGPLPGTTNDGNNNNKNNNTTIVTRDRPPPSHLSVGKDKDTVGKGSIVASSAWSPEDYPDPWTDPILCGAATTTTAVSASSSSRSGGGGGAVRIPFCDPDGVLDDDETHHAMEGLRAFAEMFDNDDAGDDSYEGTTDVAAVGGTFSGDYYEALDRRRKGGSSSRNNHNHNHPSTKKKKGGRNRVEVGIALVRRINLPAILRADSYFFYSDQDDMVNDAAQYFARYVHDAWSKRLAAETRRQRAIENENENNDYDGDGSSPSPPAAPPPAASSIVLIFVSALDRICYISSGKRVAVTLPWWRLERVVQDMKRDLRRGRTGDALTSAIREIEEMLLDGPPTPLDRTADFLQRFGAVMLFTCFTFAFATWGECRDRRKRFFLVERRSRMSKAERERARRLQEGFRTRTCPICLEPFDSTEKDFDDDDGSIDGFDVERAPDEEERCARAPRPKPPTSKRLHRVDSFGIPLEGSDGLPIKMLRCGHVFDESCWSAWANSGFGDPTTCPVCRQDVGRPTTTMTTPGNDGRRGSGIEGEAAAADAERRGQAVLPWARQPFFAALSRPALPPWWGSVPSFAGLGGRDARAAASTSDEEEEDAEGGVAGERTPLFPRASSGGDGGDY